jgi:hypothetical protein
MTSPEWFFDAETVQRIVRDTRRMITLTAAGPPGSSDLGLALLAAAQRGEPLDWRERHAALVAGLAAARAERDQLVAALEELVGLTDPDDDGWEERLR